MQTFILTYSLGFAVIWQMRAYCPSYLNYSNITDLFAHCKQEKTFAKQNILYILNVTHITSGGKSTQMIY